MFNQIEQHSFKEFEKQNNKNEKTWLFNPIEQQLFNWIEKQSFKGFEQQKETNERG